jgi:hypothetical protein
MVFLNAAKSGTGLSAYADFMKAVYTVDGE